MSPRRPPSSDPSDDPDLLLRDREAMRRLLTSARTIAVVGLSSDRNRPSHDVAEYLQQHGYQIVPINPNEREVLGERAYPRLGDVPATIRIDIVDVFRRPSEVVPHAEEAVACGARCLWLQDGVVNWDAARLANRAGLAVVMDDCILRRHRELLGS